MVGQSWNSSRQSSDRSCQNQGRLEYIEDCRVVPNPEQHKSSLDQS
jgi:hypothetical protein